MIMTIFLWTLAFGMLAFAWWGYRESQRAALAAVMAPPTPSSAPPVAFCVQCKINLLDNAAVRVLRYVPVVSSHEDEFLLACDCGCQMSLTLQRSDFPATALWNWRTP